MQHPATNRCVLLHFMTIGAIVCLVLVAPANAAGQDAGQLVMPTPSPKPQPTPIPVSAIPSRAAASADTARQAVAKAAPDARLLEIQQRFPEEGTRINELRETTEKRLDQPGPASMFKESEKAWVRVQARLDRWLADLAARSSSLDVALDDLRSRISLWRLTRDQDSAAKLPKALIQQITNAINDLSDAEKGVRSARDSILDLQASIAQEKSGVEEMLNKQQVEVSKRARGILAIDSPPLWKAFGAGGDEGDRRKQLVVIQREQWSSLKNYMTEQGGMILVWGVMWSALVMLMVVMHRKAELWVQQDPALQTAVDVLSRPVSAALVLTALLNSIIELQAPGAWTSAVGVLLVMAAWRVLPLLLNSSMRRLPIFVVLLFVLRRGVTLAPEGYFIYRLALLALALGGAAACVWLIRALQTDSTGLSMEWRPAVLRGAQFSLGLVAIGAAADIIGSVGFSALVLMGTVYAMLAAVVMVVVSIALRSMVRVGLLTKFAYRIGFAPNHSDTVRTTLFNAITFFAVLTWVAVSLRGFLLLDPLLASIRHALDWKLTIGDIPIDPGDFLIFAFTIWLSFRIANLVQFMLNVDVLPRVDLPRGVPETISRLTRYIVIAAGAVVACLAAGFDISKLTIIFGALGVGIGFGLQNIVNNFVSGLILLFERPIRVGDTLDIDDTGGIVEKIGMRASIVSTWDGAEVVVPNANLISGNVTNWTLNHERRRMVIPVSAAYHTDPQKAAQLIVDAANENKNVDAKPEPVCLFVGFGDSSLDFELRAWAAGSSFLGVASELRFAIVKKLDEAGIEIPFPQRDVHLRSADPEAGLAAGLNKQGDASKEAE